MNAPENQDIRVALKSFHEKAFGSSFYENYTATSIGSALSESDQYNQERTKFIESDLLVFDAILEWLMAVTDIFVVVLLHSSRSPNKRKWKAMLLVISAVVSQSIAIRRLVLSGLDIPAKQILRCLIEHMDLAVRLSLDPSLIPEYLKYDRIDGPKGAKKFWSLYLQKSKNYSVRDKLLRKMETIVGKAAVNDYIDYRTEEDRILNACVHPSFVSASINLTGTMYTNVEGNKPLEGLPHYGLIDEASGRTLSYAITSMAEYAMFGYLPKWKDLPKACRVDPRTSQFSREACEYTQRGCKFVLSAVPYYWRQLSATREAEQRASGTTAKKV